MNLILRGERVCRRCLQVFPLHTKSTELCTSARPTVIGIPPSYTFTRVRSFGAQSLVKWTSRQIRSAFINYFVERDHQYVHSSSILPKKGEGSYFINAGMNQFKPIFLGTADPQSSLAGYKKVVNSQKCIRVGGKHNDLEAVGQDTYHHTFFEMLGSWSFGCYFKKEACEMAWDLLTNVYKISSDRLYVTYFAGDENIGVPEDTECKNIWKGIGVPENRILPFGIKDNFWDMGETGPCGPCTEIHFDHIGNRDASSLVNRGSPDVVELWNLVFMQFDRQFDKTLQSLPQNHVDTGMGLERLTAVLQGKRSNYDTDLFQPLFDAIYQRGACEPYRGQFGAEDKYNIDTAYRIVADHARMITVALADGLRPGRQDLGSKLRQVMHRCLRQSTQTLSCFSGTLSSLVPVVIGMLGGAFPELEKNENQVIDIISHVEKKYDQDIAVGNNMFDRAFAECGGVSTLSGKQIWDLHDGRFGKHVSVDIIEHIAEQRGIGLNLEGFHEKLREHKLKTQRETGKKFLNVTASLLQQLKEKKVPFTSDSSKYNYTKTQGGYVFERVKGNVVGIVCNGQLVDSVSAGTSCCVVTDKSCFYAESGGQVSDIGNIDSEAGSRFLVYDAQNVGNYIFHVGEIQKDTLHVGDAVQIAIDEAYRTGCMRNHTATHILNFAVRSVLGNVSQAGSVVNAEKLSLNISGVHDINVEQTKSIENIANALIKETHTVYKEEMPLKEAQNIEGLVTVSGEEYPKSVRVVSVGTTVSDLLDKRGEQLGTKTSVELCGGTHVENTGDIGDFVITQIQPVSHGVRKIIAVTGEKAKEALDNAQHHIQMLDNLSAWISQKIHQDDWVYTAKTISQSLHKDLLPRVVRANIEDDLEILDRKHLNQLRNQQMMRELAELLGKASDCTSLENVNIVEITAKRIKEVLNLLTPLEPIGPLIVFVTLKSKKENNQHAMFLLPKSLQILGNPSRLVSEVCARCPDGKWEAKLLTPTTPESDPAVDIHSVALQNAQSKAAFAEIAKEVYHEFL